MINTLECDGVVIGRECSKCKVYKPFTLFPIDKSRVYGVYTSCKDCCIKKRKEKRKDPEFRDACRERSRLYKINNPEQYKKSVRNSTLKSKYGITYDEYEELFKSQGSKCGICGTKELLGGTRKMPVDHCHETGKVRGIICQPCNVSLGKVNEDISVLEALIKYIKKHKGE